METFFAIATASLASALKNERNAQIARMRVDAPDRGFSYR
jgi:hypothetical protein